MIVNLPSRSELISWANSITNANINNLQQLSDGIQFCQIFDKMYPNVINMTKIKRDDSRDLTKQHNFRQLLNAINIKQLPLKIQIIDLSSGKLTSILQLLQWFYKEYNKNFSHHGNNQKFNQGGFKEATIFKSYVGAVVPRQKSELPRQKSQFKVQSKRRSEDKDPSQRKSLDIKRLSSSAISRVSQKGSEQYNSQKELENQKDRSNRKQHFSYKVQPVGNQNSKKKDVKQENSRSQRKCMIVSATTTEQHFKKLCQQKQSERKAIRQNKKNRNNQKSLKETLEEIFDFNRNGIRNSLIKVTEVVLGQNPELESKINKVLIQQVQNDQNYVQSPKKNMFSQSGNTSLICEHDSSKKMSSMIKSQVHPFQLDRSKLNYQIFKNPSLQLNQNNVQRQQNQSKNKFGDQNINNDNNQKDTVKKSSVKQMKSKPNHPIVMQKAMISKISAQKQRIYQKNDLFDEKNGSKNQKDLLQIKSNPSQMIIQPCNSILYNPFQNSLSINIQTGNQENSMSAKLDANQNQKQNPSKKENGTNLLNAQNYAYQEQKNAKINPQTALHTDGKKSKQSNLDRKLAQSQKFDKKEDVVVDTTVWNVFTNFTQDPNWRN